ncbi:unnamed protein product [Bursaphelenchus okinawaensis]|uniref:Nucleotide-diphospho-sugar transferase domain-containing protein n=1 Tax=Bursaphelenchus okinawaensis TaxID=465554 RepID=A0A811KDH7_9BILA|nr:unnamed protein product [Bursaphelenchus okinawaensis]CAG9101581.1 unnamed protein product [Bursaphelenchus okinawaensis]
MSNLRFSSGRNFCCVKSISKQKAIITLLVLCLVMVLFRGQLNGIFKKYTRNRLMRKEGVIYKFIKLNSSRLADKLVVEGTDKDGKLEEEAIGTDNGAGGTDGELHGQKLQQDDTGDEIQGDKGKVTSGDTGTKDGRVKKDGSVGTLMDSKLKKHGTAEGKVEQTVSGATGAFGTKDDGRIVKKASLKNDTQANGTNSTPSNGPSDAQTDGTNGTLASGTNGTISSANTSAILVGSDEDDSVGSFFEVFKRKWLRNSKNHQYSSNTTLDIEADPMTSKQINKLYLELIENANKTSALDLENMPGGVGNNTTKKILPYGSGKRVKMGECKPIYGKIGVFVAFRKLEYEKMYKIAKDTLACYLKSTNYTVFYVDIFNDTEVTKQCNYANLFFQKHCAASVYLKKVDWLMVLDADTAVINPNHCIEEYIDERVDVILYERFFNFEFASGNYLVRNTPFGHKFLLEWAEHDKLQATKGFSGADNGVIHIHVLKLVMPEALNEIATCLDVYYTQRNLQEYYGYVYCVRNVLGASRFFPGKIRILRRGLAFVRDGFFTYNHFCARDFMFHGIKENDVGKVRFGTPLAKPVDLEQCGTGGYNGWYMEQSMQVPCKKMREYIKSYESYYRKGAPKQGRMIPFLDAYDVGKCWPTCDFN